jgi:ABC-type glycerol-3-phosphate transport system substrate-binding protein
LCLKRTAGLLLVASILLPSSGCAGDLEETAPKAERRWEGAELILSCPDVTWRTTLGPLVESWAYRTGALVRWRGETMQAGDDTDVAIIPAAELGSWADRGELARVPASFRQPGHPFQWTNVLLPYREYLIEWGGQAQALPLAGDAFLVVVRRDRLEDAAVRATHQRLWKRIPTPPATWEEFAELAISMTQTSGQPCLPSYHGAELAELFFRIAACYDRPALTDADQSRSSPFFFDPQTAAPRLTTPAFAHAARWLASLVKHRCLPLPPAGSDSAPPIPPSAAGQALASGQALLAVVSLQDLEQLPRTAGRVDPRFLLAPLPGSRGYYTSAGKWVPTVTPNYVPYFAGGYIGVVRQRCRFPEAAFELLGELGGPARSLEILRTPGLNAGPFRSAHLDRDRLHVWYGYRFDAERSLHLQDALRHYVRVEVRNPVVGLRAPDQARLRTAAAAELSRLLRGADPQEVIQRLSAAWQRLDADTPLADRLRWRQSSAGLAD